MNHEIVGPEENQITGQIRIPKTEAISRHIAQYSTPSMWREPTPQVIDKREFDEELKAKQIEIQLKVFELARGDFAARKLIEKSLNTLGIPQALAENWEQRHQVNQLNKLQRAEHNGDLTITIPSIEQTDVNRLEIEMEAMFSVLKLSNPIQNVLRGLKE